MARVLVIEDNATNLDLMTYLLRAFGHAPLTAMDGETGLSMARQDLPDLIVCDVQLPLLDGLEVARALKADPVLRFVPLIAVTAYAMLGDRDRVLRVGFDGYIAKPIVPETFIGQIEYFLPAELRQPQAPVAPPNRPAAVSDDRQATSRRAARVVIADDNDLARTGLRAVLETLKSLHVVGEASDGYQALAVCRELRPDLLLTDVRMPRLDGLGLTRAIKAELPKTIVLVVTGHDDPDYLFEAIKAGAAGLVLKDASRAEILDAVSRVLRGDSLLDAGLAMRLLHRLADDAQRVVEPIHTHGLTPRERDVLRLLVQGKSNRDIAAELTVAVGTVKVHVEHILAKLGVSDRTQAAVRAIDLGLRG
jgi:DNA-binding NarL/FixJ family response regulator